MKQMSVETQREVVRARAAEHIGEFAQRLAKSAPAMGSFNGIALYADSATDAQKIEEAYWSESKRRAAEWKESPEGRAVEAERQENRRRMQARHDELMAQLPTLDFCSPAALDWLCAMQEPSDTAGVIVKRQAIVDAFTRHGFEIGGDCGANYQPGMRTSEFRYLIGQALDGLANGPAIHPIIHKFADEYRAKWLAKAHAEMGGEG